MESEAFATLVLFSYRACSGADAVIWDEVLRVTGEEAADIDPEELLVSIGKLAVGAVGALNGVEVKLLTQDVGCLAVATVIIKIDAWAGH